MLSVTDNELLTRTNNDTLMGRYFRHFWQPVALSTEVAEPDGPPVRVDILGENLVAFRDSDNRIGLLESACPHRGANLFFGRNEECGLRCVYHGWKFDVEGNPIELPNVPAGAGLHQTVRAKAYPTAEYGGFLWAWMGPTDAAIPPLPAMEFGRVEPAHRYVTKQLMECNWAQVMEGDLDTAHFSFLHMPAPRVPTNDNPNAPADERRLKWIRNDPIPRFTVKDHEVGFVIGGERRAEDGQRYWRMTQYMLPSHGTGPSAMPGETYFGFTVVPIHDEACWMFTYAWNPEREIGPEERKKLAAGHGIIAKLDDAYRPVRNRDNDFGIDREVQKTRTYTGVEGLAEQDAMIQQSQGFIADRTRENLTSTDAAIVRFRRRVLDGAQALGAGEPPVAPWHPEYFCARPGSWFASDGTPLEDVMLERFGHALGRISYDER